MDFGPLGPTLVGLDMGLGLLVLEELPCLACY